jgi:hypothetical protein
MNLAREQRLRDDRRAADLAAMTKARQARRRELALVEQYLAQVRFGAASAPHVWHSLTRRR